MGRNEIRLRRQSISAGRIHRHQNYSALMRKHGRYLKFKRVLYILYVVVFIILFLLLFLVIKINKEHRLKKTKKIEMSFVQNATKTSTEIFMGKL